MRNLCTRFHLNLGCWAARVVVDLTFRDFELSPDGRYLAVAQPGKRNLLIPRNNPAEPTSASPSRDEPAKETVFAPLRPGGSIGHALRKL